MDSLRIENLRSLVDTKDISLKPITLLLGQNSSGKSTFLRCFPLLRQSVESRTSGPILWFGRFVDFGSFHEALWDSSDKNTINFHFKFKTKLLSRSVHFFSITTKLLEYSIDLELEVAEDIEQNLTYTSGCNLKIDDEHLINITFNKDGDM